ncbi:MAG: hypothetical protein K2Q01_04655, partial [Rickettsiales bacterium]|nr:hypothetical protein [Rickettsiales bacterium]
GMEAEAETAKAIQFSVATTSKGARDPDNPTPQESRAQENAIAAVSEQLKGNAQRAIEDLIKAGSVAVLWEAPGNKMDMGGTGKFAELGQQASTSLADANVMAAGKEAAV